MEFYSNNIRMKKLDWKDETLIKDGLERTVIWWKNNLRSHIKNE
jgi:nucleoside-diphosphate-sugar epimerase